MRVIRNCNRTQDNHAVKSREVHDIHLHGDYDPSWQMRHTDCAIRGVHALPSLSTGTVEIDFDVFGADDDVEFLSLCIAWWRENGMVSVGCE